MKKTDAKKNSVYFQLNPSINVIFTASHQRKQRHYLALMTSLPEILKIERRQFISVCKPSLNKDFTLI